MNRPRVTTFLALLCALDCGARGVQADFPSPNADNLPPRSVPEYPPQLEVPTWLRTNLRVAHLPPVQWRQVQEFLNAGYNVLTTNMMEKWDRVGPSAL